MPTNTHSSFSATSRPWSSSACSTLSSLSGSKSGSRQSCCWSAAPLKPWTSAAATPAPTTTTTSRWPSSSSLGASSSAPTSGPSSANPSSLLPTPTSSDCSATARDVSVFYWQSAKITSKTAFFFCGEIFFAFLKKRGQKET